MVLLLQAREPQPFIAEFGRLMPTLEVRVWPDVGAQEDIAFAFVSQIRPGVLAGLPNLRFVASLLAGVEHLVRSPEIPSDLPIVRSGSPEGDAMMTEYVLMHVLRHHRNLPAYSLQQGRAHWAPIPQKPTGERGVGFLGLGLLGRPAAMRLRDHGFKVAAWTRKSRQEAGIACFSGPLGLERMLERSEILVNLLPATEETENIINARLLSGLPHGAHFINVARGRHVVDADLIAALDSGKLAAATLDVLRVEPLPEDSPLWRHPRIAIMPHVARRARPEDSVPQVVENIRRQLSGEPLKWVVDRQVGY